MLPPAVRGQGLLDNKVKRKGRQGAPEARVRPSEPTSMQVTMSLCTHTLCSRLPSSTL